MSGSAPDGATGVAWNALAGVYDPELCLDVVSLGLVYDVRWEDGVLVVEMTLTTPGCPVSGSLPVLAKAAVAAAVGGGVVVDVRVVWDPPWSPAMADPAARRRERAMTGSHATSASEYSSGYREIFRRRAR